MGIRGNIWLVLRGLMAQTVLRVRIGSTRSAPFTRDRGIDQGCNLSTTLYAVLSNDLPGDIARAMDTGGAVPVNPQVRQALNADDYTGMAPGVETCQRMADAARAHSLTWRWEANLGKDKTAIVVFARARRSRVQDNTGQADVARPVVLWGEVQISVQATYKHLGLILRTDGKWDDHLAELAQRATSRVNQLAKIAPLAGASDVCQAPAMTCLPPVFEYGSAVWHASSAQAGLLTTQYLGALEMKLRCPAATPMEAPLGDLGMPTLEERWDLNKLRLEHRLQQLPAERVPKAVFETSWGARGASAHMWRDRVRLRWEQLVPDRAERARQQADIQLLPRAQFDTAARALVSAQENASMRRGVCAKKKLGLYAAIEQLENRGGEGFPRSRMPKVYLRGCLTPLVQARFKLRAVVAELRQELERRARGSRERQLVQACCPGCPGVVESVTHFVVECPLYSQVRNALWDQLHGVSPAIAAVLRGFPAQAQAARLQSDVVDTGVGDDVAAALHPVQDEFVDQHRRHLTRRLHPRRPRRSRDRIVSDAELRAIFAES